MASLSGFDIKNESGSLPSSAIFWKSLSRIGVQFSHSVMSEATDKELISKIHKQLLQLNINENNK